MLETKLHHPVVGPGFPAPELDPSIHIFNSTIGFVRRHISIMIFALLVALAIGGVYLFTSPPIFAAQARLIIDTKKGQLFQQQSIIGDIPIDAAAVESQVEVLKSENVALSVIKQLRLTEDPEFVGSGGGGLVGAVFGLASNKVAADPPSEQELTRRAMRTLSSRLDIKRIGLSYVIEISFRSLDAGRAAQIANAVAEAYVVDQLEAKYDATRRASVWLQDRIKELRQQASGAESAVVDYKTKNNIVDAGGKLMNEQQIGELNTQLVTARAHTSEAKARLDRIETVLRADTPDATVNSTVTDSINNQVVAKLRTQYLDLANREADWSTRYGRNHLAAINLRNQMGEIRKSILDELRRLAESYKSDFEIAKLRQEGIEKDLAAAVSQSQATNQVRVALRDLESTAETYRALHDNFLQRYTESIQQQSFPITEARLISRASRPLQKSQPQTILVLAMASIVGLIMGAGIGILRELTDRVIRTKGQVEALLDTDCIAVLPRLKMRPLKTSPCGSGPRIIVRNQSPMWAMVDSPFSRYAEEMRAIKLAVDLNGIAKSNKVIGFTSSVPNEGKSTVAGSLAQLVARSGASVILVDCDFRNPSLSRALAPGAIVGILEVLAGDASLDDAIWTEPSTKMKLLPAAIKSRLAHTNEILSSDATMKLFGELRKRYDYVIADFSPLAPIVDVRATTQLVDSYVFVIEWARTKVDTVESSLSGAKDIYKKLAGVVLNKADFKVMSRYENHGENYYYNKHYARYGYMA
jgi:polysaccharide biosynthesis transport protein